MPTIDDLVNLFETLDIKKNGYLTSNDMRRFMEHMRYVVATENLDPTSQQGNEAIGTLYFSAAAQAMGQSERYDVRNKTQVAAMKKGNNGDDAASKLLSHATRRKDEQANGEIEMEFPNQDQRIIEEDQEVYKQEAERLKVSIDQLLLEFDLSGDQRISPEEFFNMVMMLYE